MNESEDTFLEAAALVNEERLEFQMSMTAVYCEVFDCIMFIYISYKQLDAFRSVIRHCNLFSSYPPFKVSELRNIEMLIPTNVYENFDSTIKLQQRL